MSHHNYDDRRGGSGDRRDYYGSNRGRDDYRDDSRGDHYQDDRRRGSGDYARHDDDRYSQGHSSGHSGDSGRYDRQSSRDAYEEVASQMGNMRIESRATRGGRGGMYGQHSDRGRGGRGRGSGPSSSGRGLAPVAKSDLVHNTQKFAERPKTLVQDKKIGEKLEVMTNHAIVQLPEETLQLHVYNIEVVQNKKTLIKREEASPLFWELFKRAYRELQLTPTDVIFNDVNMLWSVKKMPRAVGTVSPPSASRSRVSFNYKYTGAIDFGANLSPDQQDQLIPTLVDAIATSRTRHPSETVYTVFKRITFLVEQKPVELALDGIDLYKSMGYGMDARVGLSFAVKMNLRAGITACFDINHTLFSKPGYPVIRLLCDIIMGRTLTDEEYEQSFDNNLKNANPVPNHLKKMKQIMTNMSLTYCIDTAIDQESALKKQKAAAPEARSGRRDPRAPKDFKFYDLADSAEKETFLYRRDDNDAGIEMSIADYYLNAYNIRLRYPNLPCIQRKPTAKAPRIIFPMEMCSYIINPARFEGIAPRDLRDTMIRDTTYSPEQRKVLLQHIIGQLPTSNAPPFIDNNDKYMKAHGLSIGKEMLACKATLLPPPTVVYGNSSFVDKDHLGEWEAIRNEPVRTVLEQGKIERDGNREKVLIGSIIVVHHPNNDGDLNMDDIDLTPFHRLMNAVDTAGQMVYWMDAENRIPMCLDIHHYRNTDKPQDLHAYIESVRVHIETTDDYKSDDYVVVPIFFLLFHSRCSLDTRYMNNYNLLKHLCDNMIGVYTQGMLIDNYYRVLPKMSTCPLTCHMVEKILGKIGTTHRKLERGKSHKPWMILTDPAAPTLVLGIDVSHPKASNRVDKSKPDSVSVASIVGNIDTEITQFRSSSKIQDSDKEQIVRMEHQILARLEEFITNTKTRPAHIVVYRDGISEGDFQRYLYEERTTIEESCKRIDPDYTPTLTYILVSKRHHTKFFPLNPDESYAHVDYNVKPGTLVEDVVTSSKYFDFFLATQVGQMGTSRPTHYYVLHDTWAPLDSFWQTVTHALTYNFCRTTSTIALPAPVMYAHLAAKRAKEAFDAAVFCENVQGINVNMERKEDLVKIEMAIQMNTKLDGMVFV